MQKQPHTILIIDDEPKIRRSLALVLEKEGYQVITAASGNEAQNHLKTVAVNLIILDLKLPDLHGMELLSHIQQVEPDIPVFILTAHASLDTAMEAVRKGARDYLVKPVSPDLLIDRVGEILAEQVQPTRRREIVGQILDLWAELTKPALGDGRGANLPFPPNPDPDRYLTQGDLQLDLHTRQVTFAGRSVHLAPTTFNYLATLIRHAPEPVGYENLVEESQGYRVSRIEAREIAVWHVHELRCALESNPHHPQFILTVRNTGYRLQNY